MPFHQISVGKQPLGRPIGHHPPAVQHHRPRTQLVSEPDVMCADDNRFIGERLEHSMRLRRWIKPGCGFIQHGMRGAMLGP